ncbi:MAG TPA: Cof-type HAD-IIB family hydrolase [Actinotalea sp.]|nr:Cof-type HAD-IIB family hydrolase [Actinotalea sp.]
MTSADGPAHPATHALDLPPAAEAAGLRMVVLDMDGTLLDDDHRVDPDFWPLAREAVRRGIVLCAASGRQQATLAMIFGDLAPQMVFVAENGAHVVSRGAQISADVLDRATVEQAVGAVRALAARGARVGTVVSGTRSAYVEGTDPDFLTEAARYYVRLEQVPDLLAVQDDPIKIAVHDVAPVVEAAYPALLPLARSHTVVLSGEHWTDLTMRGTNKGVALRRVQAALGVTAQQTAAFGDHLNDLEMLDAAGMSFAMANAHPEVLARARFRAPANVESGVTRTLAALLSPPRPPA